jgi:sugar (pentulose or hexulose) kinase
LGITLISVEAADASAVGAAMLGHQALGSASIPELVAKIENGSIYEPDDQLHVFYDKLHDHFQSLYQQIIQEFSLIK